MFYGDEPKIGIVSAARRAVPRAGRPAVCGNPHTAAFCRNRGDGLLSGESRFLPW